MSYALSITAEAVTKDDGCYRFHYLRTSREILIYHGDSLDTTAHQGSIKHVAAKDFILEVTRYLDAS